MTRSDVGLRSSLANVEIIHSRVIVRLIEKEILIVKGINTIPTLELMLVDLKVLDST